MRAGWLRAFTAVVPPLLRAFEPEVLVTQFGCDGHRLDIMSDLELSVDGMRRAYRILHEEDRADADGDGVPARVGFAKHYVQLEALRPWHPRPDG